MVEARHRMRVAAAEQIDELNLTSTPESCASAYTVQALNESDFDNVDIAMAVHDVGITVSAARNFDVQRRNVAVMRDFAASCPSFELTAAGVPTAVKAGPVTVSVDGVGEAFGVSIVMGNIRPSTGCMQPREIMF